MSKRERPPIDDEFTRLLRDEMAKAQSRQDHTYSYKRAVRLQVLGELLGRYNGCVDRSLHRHQRLEFELAVANREVAKMRELVELLTSSVVTVQSRSRPTVV